MHPAIYEGSYIRDGVVLDEDSYDHVFTLNGDDSVKYACNEDDMLDNGYEPLLDPSYYEEPARLQALFLRSLIIGENSNLLKGVEKHLGIVYNILVV